jgi:hypothetical protein
LQLFETAVEEFAVDPDQRMVSKLFQVSIL